MGQHKGKYYSVNVPLKDGIDDESYNLLFKPIMAKVMEMYAPDAVVFQSGADSLTGDRLGCFNLSIRGHAECLKYMTTFQVPLLVLGGGGYTIRNVARCWTYETGCLLGHELEDKVSLAFPKSRRLFDHTILTLFWQNSKMPTNDYSEYFGPTHTLQIQPSNMENQNTPEYLEGVRNRILENLSKIPPKPSVPFHDVPPDAFTEDQMEVKEDPDEVGGGAEANAARRANPDSIYPDEGTYFISQIQRLFAHTRLTLSFIYLKATWTTSRRGGTTPRPRFRTATRTATSTRRARRKSRGKRLGKKPFLSRVREVVPMSSRRRKRRRERLNWAKPPSRARPTTKRRRRRRRRTRLTRLPRLWVPRWSSTAPLEKKPVSSPCSRRDLPRGRASWPTTTATNAEFSFCDSGAILSCSG